MSDKTREVVLTVRQWQTIDAELDSVGHSGMFAGDGTAVQKARRLREYGWHLSRSHPQTQQGDLGWPPANGLFMVALGEDDWTFVRGCLERARTSSRPADAGRPQTATRSEQETSQVLVEEVIAAVDGVTAA